ncbi:MAG: response regulator [Calditrichaeota bacterium]|nr:MAG: response regulator [Calditrichota bacterium]
MVQRASLKGVYGETVVNEKNVLIVDDEEDITWSLGKHLEKDREFYRTQTCNSAAEALNILKKRHMDLVITDIRMPEISGLDLLMKIRQLYPHIKVIIMTAYGNSEIQEEANRRGCFKYIEKPFEIRELRDLIRNTLEDRKGFTGSLEDFQLGDLIQMNCLGRLTNAIRVQSGSQTGTIYFDDGNIVHAEVGDLVGEEAFYEIIMWPGGNFALNKSLKAENETILKGWQSLLLEGLRRKDEASNSELAEARALDEVRHILKTFFTTKGVQLIIFFKPDGEPWVWESDRPGQTESQIRAITELTRSWVALQSETARLHGMEQIKEMLMDYENGLVKLIWMPNSRSYLLILADNSTNFGLLRIESKKHMSALADVIRTHGLFKQPSV